ncbi:D-alanine--D-alanine ligase [Flavobacterium sp. NRK1]|uniref:D-alanine--D-alanine ligase n=1 Tax=Flavobacterium sp. NRK1 TaxID=2954929 RepID=UPI002091F610|nr:D-alanine--D-alanine ligase [Flavobacterium sp. NRK1]MCO6146658.1 D-alanine--D-alanine ligase [Flavobacterium sp. NRK1]
MRSLLHKIVNWEYWPFQVLYIPIYFQWLYYSFRSKSLFFFNAVNPSMKNGGFFMESKMDIYDLIPQKYYPKTVLIDHTAELEKVKLLMTEKEIGFPAFVKPDIGLRGNAVKKIYNYNELANYLHKADFDFLIQESINLPNEIGVFYIRFPEEQKGTVTGIVEKELLSVTGDGTSTILQLLDKNPRFRMQIKALKKEYGQKLNNTLQKDEVMNLVPYGNHARGAKFIDSSHLISPELEKVIDTMCMQIQGFHFGRIDLMYNSIAELEKGENFMIVEVNGASSEPTHIYDPSHSLLFAWKELARHISYLHKISRANHEKGNPYLDFATGMSQWKLQREHNKRITSF